MSSLEMQDPAPPEEVPLDAAEYMANYEERCKARKERILMVRNGKKPKWIGSKEFVNYMESDSSSKTKVNWIDIEFPTKETIDKLCNMFKIHRMTMIDLARQENDEHGQKNERMPLYRYVLFSEHHEIILGYDRSKQLTKTWKSVDVHILLPEGSTWIFTLHHGPVIFVADTLRNFMKKVKPLEELDAKEYCHQLPQLQSECLTSKVCGKPSSPFRLFRTSPSSRFFASNPYQLLPIILKSMIEQMSNVVAIADAQIEQLEDDVEVMSPEEQQLLLPRIHSLNDKITFSSIQLAAKVEVLNSILNELDVLGGVGCIRKLFQVVYAEKPRARRTPRPPINPDKLPSDIIRVPHSKRAKPAKMSVRVYGRELELATVNESLSTAAVRVQLRDLLDALNSLVVRCSLQKDLVQNLSNAYNVRVSIEMNLLAKYNSVLTKWFGALSVIFFPILVISGQWSINVFGPGFGFDVPGTNLWEMGTIAGAYMFGVILFYTLLRWVGWL